MGNQNKSRKAATVDVSVWLADAELATLIDALQSAGEIRFIGGAVRDALLDIPHNDIDLATTAKPDAIMRAGTAAGFRMVPTGLDHGTVTAVLKRGPVEITTLRRDVATDGRHATVQFTDDWAIDAARRDFTINALSADRGGQVFDYHGGLDDLAARRVCFIGDAGTRIREDYLRAFRFFRLSGRYADDLDAAALTAVKQNLGGIKGLSGERIASELLKLLAEPRPDRMWQGMVDTGLIAACLPLATDCARLIRLVAMESELKMADSLRRLRATLPDGTAWLQPMVKRLRLSTEQKKRLAGASDPEAIVRLLEAGNYAEALYRNDGQAVMDTALIAAASGTLPQDKLPSLLAAMVIWVRPVFPLGGENLMELGLKPGPIFGALLREVEEWWIAQRFQPTREQCFAELKRIWKTTRLPDSYS